MKRLQLTPDELDLVLAKRKEKATWNQALRAASAAIKDLPGTGQEESLVSRAGVLMVISKLECE